MYVVYLVNEFVVIYGFFLLKLIKVEFIVSSDNFFSYFFFIFENIDY